MTGLIFRVHQQHYSIFLLEGAGDIRSQGGFTDAAYSLLAILIGTAGR